VYVADGVFGRPHVEGRNRLERAVGHDEFCRHALWEHERRSARTVCVGDRRPSGNLHRDCSVEIDRCDPGVQWDQGDVGNDDEFLPRRLYLALSRQNTGASVVHSQHTTAVDREIEHAVVAAHGLSELGMVEDRNRDTRQGAAIAIHHLSAQDDHPGRIDGAVGDAGLDPVRSGV